MASQGSPRAEPLAPDPTRFGWVRVWSAGVRLRPRSVRGDGGGRLGTVEAEGAGQFSLEISQGGEIGARPGPRAQGPERHLQAELGQGGDVQRLVESLELLQDLLRVLVEGRDGGAHDLGQ